ncbi:MAG: TIGR02757 family protein [Chlorobi bacterium]|nr:TIGR02757 family protein [Chlorobiota bacterium]
MSDIKKILETYRTRWIKEGWYNYDPIQFPLQYDNRQDREVVGILAALLAWGRRDIIANKMRYLLALLGRHPAQSIMNDTYDRRELELFKHRIYKGRHILILLDTIAELLTEHGTIAKGFEKLEDGDIAGAMQDFYNLVIARTPKSDERIITHLVPDPSRGSACKRMTMFLRWMVRREYPDMGLWTEFSPAHLLISLDVHAWRAAKHLGLTSYANPSLKAAIEVTRNVSELMGSEDPAKYDVALWLLGKDLSEKKSVVRL